MNKKWKIGQTERRHDWWSRIPLICSPSQAGSRQKRSNNKHWTKHCKQQAGQDCPLERACSLGPFSEEWLSLFGAYWWNHVRDHKTIRSGFCLSPSSPGHRYCFVCVSASVSESWLRVWRCKHEVDGPLITIFTSVSLNHNLNQPGASGGKTPLRIQEEEEEA